MNPRTLLATIKSTFNGNRMLVYGMKYIPVAGTALASLHVLLLLMGIYEPYTICLAVALLLGLLMLLSYRFNFCKLHKAMIGFMILMVICICVRKIDGFGVTLTIFRVIMLLVGLILTILGIYKQCGNGDCE